MLLLIMSCATTPGPGLMPGGSLLDAGGFSIVLPGDSRWIVIRNSDTDIEAIQPRYWQFHDAPQGYTLIHAFEVRILDDDCHHWTDQEMAADYFNNEESIMRTYGEGQYRVEKVEFRMVRIRGWTWHAMDLDISSKKCMGITNVTIKASLFLHFPEDLADAGRFFAVFVSESKKKGSLIKNDIERFRPVLASLVVKAQ